MLSKKLEDKIVDIVSSHLESEEGEVYSAAVRKAVRHYVNNDEIARDYLKMEKNDPGVLVDLTIDDIYYGAIGYPIRFNPPARKKKSSKSPKRKPVKKCKCK